MNHVLWWNEGNLFQRMMWKVGGSHQSTLVSHRLLSSCFSVWAASLSISHSPQNSNNCMSTSSSLHKYNYWLTFIIRHQDDVLARTSHANTNPVEYIRPALHGDALKHSEHGKHEVVEVCDAPVGAVPALLALGAINGTCAAVTVNSTRRRFVLYHIWTERRRSNINKHNSYEPLQETIPMNLKLL